MPRARQAHHGRRPGMKKSLERALKQYEIDRKVVSVGARLMEWGLAKRDVEALHEYVTRSELPSDIVSMVFDTVVEASEAEDAGETEEAMEKLMLAVGDDEELSRGLIVLMRSCAGFGVLEGVDLGQRYLAEAVEGNVNRADRRRRR